MADEAVGKTKKPLYKMWWFWAIVVLVVIGAIAVAGGDATDTTEPAATEPAAEEPTEAESAQEPTAEESPEEPTLTMGQQQAIDKANEYLRTFAFSRQGLIDQLVFEGFSTEDATFAVDHIAVDWNEQAAKKAQDYLDLTSFSRQGLKDQLIHDGFTEAQAEYAVQAVGY